MDTMIIYVCVESVYGRDTIRPDCEVSKSFCKLLKQKTLTKEDVETIKELGYVIKMKEVIL